MHPLIILAVGIAIGSALTIGGLYYIANLWG